MSSQQVVQRNPLGDVAVNPKRYQVSFLSAELEPATVEKLSALAAPEERFVADGRELYAWHPDGVARSKLWNRLASTGLGVTATARNWTTVTTLLTMADNAVSPSHRFRLHQRLSAFGRGDCLGDAATGGGRRALRSATEDVSSRDREHEASADAEQHERERDIREVVGSAIRLRSEDEQSAGGSEQPNSSGPRGPKRVTTRAVSRKESAASTIVCGRNATPVCSTPNRAPAPSVCADPSLRRRVTIADVAPAPPRP